MRITMFGYRLIICELRKVRKRGPWAPGFTMKFEEGKARVFLYAPFDNLARQPDWRFSMKKAVGTKKVRNREGEIVEVEILRESFYASDVSDLHVVLDETFSYIQNATSPHVSFKRAL